jgi:hypothetical protein
MSNTDYTVRIFNQFYNLDIRVNSSEYEIVKSYFDQYTSDEEVSKSLTETLFRISTETKVSVIELLDTFDFDDKLKVNLTLAYYLNSISKNKTVLYGVNQLIKPNDNVQRNILI